MNTQKGQYGKWVMLMGALILFLLGWQKFYTPHESSTPYLIGSLTCVLVAILWSGFEPDRNA